MELNEKILFGIDYNSSDSDRTVLCLLDELEGKIQFIVSSEREDPNEVIKQQILSKSPAYVFIDAPLSLPRAYFDSDYEDYLYRESDKELGCQSPMETGLLTANAIKLRHSLQQMSNIPLKETCPKELAKIYQLEEAGYRGHISQIKEVVKVLQEKTEHMLDTQFFTSWQHVDAFLAMMSSLRFKNDEAKEFGNKKEGKVFV